MTKINDLHRKWMKTKDYRQAHEALAPEYVVARAVIQACVAGLTQEQLAKRLAVATGTRLRITFEPRHNPAT
jgi:hypothetical protein